MSPLDPAQLVAQLVGRHPVAVSISTGKYNETNIVALCNDGTLWEYSQVRQDWYQLPAIPQPTPQETR
jgi:hypothetical protein